MPFGRDHPIDSGRDPADKGEFSNIKRDDIQLGQFFDHEGELGRQKDNCKVTCSVVAHFSVKKELAQFRVKFKTEPFADLGAWAKGPDLLSQPQRLALFLGPGLDDVVDGKAHERDAQPQHQPIANAVLVRKGLQNELAQVVCADHRADDHHE